MRIIKILKFKSEKIKTYQDNPKYSQLTLLIQFFIIQMIFQSIQQRIEQQPNYMVDQKPLSQNPQPEPILQEEALLTPQPIQYMMDFVPPPINDSSKYHDQLQNDFLETLSKNANSVDYIKLFGEKRPLDIKQKKIADPLFVDGVVKTKLKKVVKGVYQRMVQTLKYCAGQMPLNQGSPLHKVEEKSHQFMLLCEQVRSAQTKTTIWKLMSEETKQMNEKAEEIQNFIEQMVQYCKNQIENEQYA